LIKALSVKNPGFLQIYSLEEAHPDALLSENNYNLSTAPLGKLSFIRSRSLMPSTVEVDFQQSVSEVKGDRVNRLNS
jgi:hypothetical protein